MQECSGYKDSGAAWIGKIPCTWDVHRLKIHLKRVEEKNPGDMQVLSLYRELGIVPKDSRDDNHNVTSEDTSKYKYVKVGDFVVNKMKAWQGSVAVSDYEGIVSPAYYVYKFTDSNFYGRYFHYLLRSCYREEFMRLSEGIRIGQWDLSSGDLDNVPVLLPPMQEQKAIALYLDNTTKSIDDLISEAKASIEEYKSWKASIIYEAVTKGIDSHVEMKDSGVEWIGNIPSNWQCLRFKFVASIKANLVDPQDYPNLPQVAPDNIVKDAGILLRCNSVAEEGVISWNHLFYKGQILYSKIRPMLNKVVIAPFDGLCSADMYPIETAQNTTFMLYAMLSKCFVQQVALCTADRVKMPKINREELGNIKIALPPIEEQELISNYLNVCCNRFDAIISEKESLVVDLESYKKSLIFEVVTGKRRVV